MKTLRFLRPALLCLFYLLLVGPAARAQALANGTPAVSTSDGVRLYVRVAGQGRPCVFVHGGPGAGSETIETLAGPMLEQRFQMIYLDQRGSGRSASSPTKAYGLPRLVQDLEDLRQQLHLERWVLMSHSFGGLIATAYARQYPQHVLGLVLTNSILNLPASMESMATKGYALLPAATRPPLDAAAPLPQRFGMVMALLNQQHLMGRLMYATDSAAARVARAQRRQATANHDFAASLYQPGVIDGYLEDLTASTPQMTLPVLVLPGQTDDVTGPQHESFRFPHQRVVALPGKHYVLLETPNEVSRALAAFSRELPK
ncbi:alpha/beta fold hydrolase [Hymenobacter armeniacus]|uniref:Alpha/beta hydrolase n=1 Tax=Hymenobacter armeniacus TaxID=2771358 RepID=A0ABR8JVD1_9BACT|nr:alpha/beta hydrolase [Hymenobacter armeniacus]MBD2723065.1 alpha/beta hydrolase [Hymenobacter armeniacus]